MLIELGNNRPRTGETSDGAPAVTTIHIPEADKKGLGGYTFEDGLSVTEFRKELADAQMFGRALRLPHHEALIAIHLGWMAEGLGNPEWLQVSSLEHTHGLKVGHSPKAAKQIENFLHEHFGTDGYRKPPDVEDRYHTRYGAPGQGQPQLPDLKMLFTNPGRVMANLNDGGGQTGTSGTATATSPTSLTNSGAAWTPNGWVGYRVYAPPYFGNVTGNTATQLTVDRWYNPATPGGAAGGPPAATAGYVIADGGATSAWFVALSTTDITATMNAADTALSGEYTTAGGGMIRKIAPYAQTSGVISRSITLMPVYTANATDVGGGAVTFRSMAAYASIIVGAGLMKFETPLSGPALVSIPGDQVALTYSVTGS